MDEKPALRCWADANHGAAERAGYLGTSRRLRKRTRFDGERNRKRSLSFRSKTLTASSEGKKPEIAKEKSEKRNRWQNQDSGRRLYGNRKLKQASPVRAREGVPFPTHEPWRRRKAGWANIAQSFPEGFRVFSPKWGAERGFWRGG